MINSALGAWSSLASSSPVAGICESAPQADTSPSRTSRDMRMAINSTSLYSRLTIMSPPTVVERRPSGGPGRPLQFPGDEPLHVIGMALDVEHVGPQVLRKGGIVPGRRNILFHVYLVRAVVPSHSGGVRAERRMHHGVDEDGRNERADRILLVEPVHDFLGGDDDVLRGFCEDDGFHRISARHVALTVCTVNMK